MGRQPAQGKKLRFAVEDPDAPENWPRLWFIWRGNALLSNAKGHEYFLKHYLGTHTNSVADEVHGFNFRSRLGAKIAPEESWTLLSTLTFEWTLRLYIPTLYFPPRLGTKRATLTPLTCTPTFIHSPRLSLPVGNLGATGRFSSRSQRRSANSQASIYQNQSRRSWPFHSNMTPPTKWLNRL